MADQAAEEAAVPEHDKPEPRKTEPDVKIITEIDEPQALADEPAEDQETPEPDDEPQPESAEKNQAAFSSA